MSICQFCKEEVREEAIKCRHCGSVLGEDAEKPANTQVTYVVDRDIVRFAKFALPTLLIFLIAGAFLYGFDIRIAAREIRELRDETRTDRDAVKLLMEDAEDLHRKSKDLLTTTTKSLEQANDEVEQTKDQISLLEGEIGHLGARLGTAQEVLSTIVNRTSNLTTSRSTESDAEAVLAEFFSRHRDSVLMVMHGTSTVASGLVVSSEGHVLTADYVVKQARSESPISAVAADGRPLGIEVVEVDREKGLALLKTQPYDSMAVLELTNDVPTTHTPVIAIGAGRQRTLRAVEGVVSDVSDEWLTVTFDEDVQGFGGGPVLTLDGKVVGIVYARTTVGGPPIDRCKRSDAIKAFLVSHGVQME